MVEAGSRFVTVLWDAPDGYSWDSHRSSQHLEKHLVPGFAQAFSALLVDLEDRGLLEETLVVAGGEMGRTPHTPKITKTCGRDHHVNGYSIFMAGGGFRGGYVHGATDEWGHYAAENIVKHTDYHYTLLHLFGLAPEKLVYKRNGREQSLIDDQPGRIVSELLKRPV